MLSLSGSDVTDLLPMKQAVELVAQAMVTTSKGQNTLPLRHAMPLSDGNMLGIMPGALQEPACYGTKLISLYPNNPAEGHSSHLGLMVLFERTHGTPIAILNAGALTAIRTAAASAVATRALARQDAQTLAIIGTGEQASYHIEAIQTVRDISHVIVAGRTPKRAQAFVDALQGKHSSTKYTAAQNAQTAVQDADIICTVTSSRETVLQGDWLAAGAHVNAVGASIPSMREIDEALITRATLFVDYRPSVLAQAKDVMQAIETGAITEAHIVAEIGDVLDGGHGGRSNAQEITLYRSMGIAAQDLICAHHVLEMALKSGKGTEFSIA